MTNEEFSNAFDTLLSSYLHASEFGELTSIADVSLDEYEKSIFLTLALDLIVKSYFERHLNSNGAGFDDSTRRLMDYANLITTKTLLRKLYDSSSESEAFSSRGIMVNFNTNYDSGNAFGCSKDDYYKSPLFIINERVETTIDDNKTRSYVVVPLNYKDYDRMLSRAYNEPLKRLAWRLFETDSNNLTTSIELILRSDAGNFAKYIVRYVRRPRPIVLVDLSNTDNELSIDGVKTVTQCELNPVIHNEILLLAVQLALNSKGIETRDMKAAREEANRRKSQ